MRLRGRVTCDNGVAARFDPNDVKRGPAGGRFGRCGRRRRRGLLRRRYGDLGHRRGGDNGRSEQTDRQILGIVQRQHAARGDHRGPGDSADPVKRFRRNHRQPTSTQILSGIAGATAPFHGPDFGEETGPRPGSRRPFKRMPDKRLSPLADFGNFSVRKRPARPDPRSDCTQAADDCHGAVMRLRFAGDDMAFALRSTTSSPRAETEIFRRGAEAAPGASRDRRLAQDPRNRLDELDADARRLRPAAFAAIGPVAHFQIERFRQFAGSLHLEFAAAVDRSTTLAGRRSPLGKTTNARRSLPRRASARRFLIRAPRPCQYLCLVART